MLLDKIKDFFKTLAKEQSSIVPVDEPKIETPKPVQIPVIPSFPVMQTISKQGLLELADREGLAQTKYLDSVGVQTIGIGQTKSDIPDLGLWSWAKELSVQEVCSMYKKHVQPYSDAVAKALKVPVKQYQFDALVSITYNIGIFGMRTSTFMKRINAGEQGQAVVDAIMMWKKPPEIIGRRKKECDLYRYGKYSNADGCVDHIQVDPKTHKPKYKGRIKIIDYL